MLQPLRTADQADSIWKNLTEEKFRKDVVKLVKIAEQPIAPGSAFDELPGQKTPGIDTPKFSEKRLLPLELERSLANDFAFIAATEQGARSVAACCIEEDGKRHQLTIRLAGNHGVPPDVESGIKEICNTLQKQLSGGETLP